jgi:hypothetical protein
MITTAELSHLHRFVPATVSGKAPILLLHGTGGDENDLLPLGHTVAPGAALLSPRGKVLEGGMPRFFRRLVPMSVTRIAVRACRCTMIGSKSDAGYSHSQSARLYPPLISRMSADSLRRALP